MPKQGQDVVIVGAGLGGLATAMRLAHAGFSVHVLESAATPGGKMRAFPSAAGPVDAGPTVLTMRHVFDDLFHETSAPLEDFVTLEPEEVLARHWWPGGSCLDLRQDFEANVEAIEQFAGAVAAKEFRSFSAQTATLFDGFQEPMMDAAAPGLAGLTAHVLKHPHLIRAMKPLQTLSQNLARQFSDPRLRQLFGRYATYVGGSPFEAPAVLSLIWQSEQRGVWRVKGGMHKLAVAMAERAKALGVRFSYNTEIARIEVQNGRAVSAISSSGERFAAEHVVFNGDPAALRKGLLGPGVAAAVKDEGVQPRSLSAWVHAFAAKVSGPDLAYHNVFFCADPQTEFGPIRKGALPTDATLYVCAQDRGDQAHPQGLERFEIILNGAPTHKLTSSTQEISACQTLVFQTLKTFGVRFTPTPDARTLTTPGDFHKLFPGSEGSLYGRSPHGMRAAFQRPVAQSQIPGLILTGGGVHPGAGIPMATLSGKHAAETILKSRASTSQYRPMDMHGGMSMASPTTRDAPFQS